MAPHPVRGHHGTFELLAVHDAGEGQPDAEGHPTRRRRIYAGIVNDDGSAGVARVDKDLCDEGLRILLEKYNR